MGDIAGAASVLDSMVANELELSVYVFNSAILACANAEPPSHKAAMYFFDALLNHGFSPTVVTFTNLARAHATASLAEIQRVRATANENNIHLNAVFAECYVRSLFQRRLAKNAHSVKAVQALLADLPGREERLKEAHSALLQLQASNVVLSRLCHVIIEYLRQEGL